MDEETPKPEDTVVPPTDNETITSTDQPIVPAPDTEKDELKQKLATYEFKEKLGEVSKTYPHASEFSDEIGTLVSEKGYSIEDASVIVLNKNGRMQTAEQIARQANQGGSSGIGGSMDNPPPRDKKVPQPGEPGAIEYWATKLQELEAKGEIRIV